MQTVATIRGLLQQHCTIIDHLQHQWTSKCLQVDAEPDGPLTKATIFKDPHADKGASCHKFRHLLFGHACLFMAMHFGVASLVVNSASCIWALKLLSALFAAACAC